MGDFKKNGTEVWHFVRNFKFVIQVIFMCYFEVGMSKFVKQLKGHSENIYFIFYDMICPEYAHFWQKTHKKILWVLGTNNNGYQHYCNILSSTLI